MSYVNYTVLDDGFTVGQAYRSLKKCWIGYRIAKVDGNKEEMTIYAERIRKLQRQLGLRMSLFPHLLLED